MSTTRQTVNDVTTAVLRQYAKETEAGPGVAKFLRDQLNAATWHPRGEGYVVRIGRFEFDIVRSLGRRARWVAVAMRVEGRE